MRALIAIALFTLQLAAGCRGDAAPERAGEVVRVSGDVTRVRGDASAPLAVGDRVEGGDRVRTGDGAEVAIKLAHNGVTLVYGANADVVLKDAPGWSASGDVSAGVLDRDPDDKTAAGGVNSEHQAADDPRTALENKQTGASTEDPTDDSTDTIATPPETGATESPPGGGDDRHTGTSSDKVPDPVNERATSGKGKDVDDGKTLEAPPIRVRGGSGAAVAAARRVLAVIRGRVAACVAGDEGPDAVTLVLTLSKGSMTATSIGLPTEAERQCVAKVIAGVKVPPAIVAKDLRATIRLR